MLLNIFICVNLCASVDVYENPLRSLRLGGLVSSAAQQRAKMRALRHFFRFDVAERSLTY